jgi:hypothetical protein
MKYQECLQLSKSSSAKKHTVDFLTVVKKLHCYLVLVKKNKKVF